MFAQVGCRVVRSVSRLRAGSLWTLSAMGCLAAATAGCVYPEGGIAQSRDVQVFVSTSHQPKTVTVRDSRTGEVFLSIDVPVGQKLVLDFDQGGGTEGDFTPDLLKYGLMDPDKNGSLSESMPVPPPDSRQVEMTLRPAPELPDDMLADGSSRTPPDAPPEGSR